MLVSLWAPLGAVPAVAPPLAALRTGGVWAWSRASSSDLVNVRTALDENLLSDPRPVSSTVRGSFVLGVFFGDGGRFDFLPRFVAISVAHFNPTNGNPSGNPTTGYATYRPEEFGGLLTEKSPNKGI